MKHTTVTEKPRRALPDDMNTYEMGFSESEMYALIRGEVPEAVQNFAISIVTSFNSTITEKAERDRLRKGVAA